MSSTNQIIDLSFAYNKDEMTKLKQQALVTNILIRPILFSFIFLYYLLKTKKPWIENLKSYLLSINESLFSNTFNLLMVVFVGTFSILVLLESFAYFYRAHKQNGKTTQTDFCIKIDKAGITLSSATTIVWDTISELQLKQLKGENDFLIFSIALNGTDKLAPAAVIPDRIIKAQNLTVENIVDTIKTIAPSNLKMKNFSSPGEYKYIFSFH